MLPSALAQIAGERKGSWDQARLSLVIPIGVIVAVAIVCVVVAVLTSAQRADEVSFNHEQQLIRQAVLDQGERSLRQVESAVMIQRGTAGLRTNYDAGWVDRRVGKWLQTFFRDDLVVVVDGLDQVKYALAGPAVDSRPIDLRADFASSLDLLRGRLSALPGRTLPVIATQDPAKPGRRTALIQRVTNRPAIVAAVAVGSDADLAAGNEHAPIVLAVKYIDQTMLREISAELQLPDLQEMDDTAQADERFTTISDLQGETIARFAWKPTRPGGQIVASVVPFIVVALAGFALLVGLVHAAHAAYR